MGWGKEGEGEGEEDLEDWGEEEEEEEKEEEEEEAHSLLDLAASPLAALRPSPSLGGPFSH